jgi:hypothetical protein
LLSAPVGRGWRRKLRVAGGCRDRHAAARRRMLRDFWTYTFHAPHRIGTRAVANQSRAGFALPLFLAAALRIYGAKTIENLMTL